MSNGPGYQVFGFRLTSTRTIDKLQHRQTDRIPTLIGLSLMVMAISISVAPAAFAKDYLIEVIVFSQPSDAATAELWNNDTTLKKTRTNAIKQPRSRADAPEFFSPVLLSNAAAAIQRRGGFQVLSHVGWRQSGAARIDSPVIRLPRTNTSANLEGWIRIYLNTYIFAEMDLTYNNDDVSFRTRDPNSSTDRTSFGDSTTGPFANASGVDADNIFANAPFKLREKRRVKFKEVHYFDHPRLGVILTVQPAETSG